jgi:hypothetical protein
MPLFGKRSPAIFELPSDLRSDIRSVLDSAPPAASGWLRRPDALPALMVLNARIPADEAVLALVHCLKMPQCMKGYLALSSSRLIYAFKPETGDPQLTAIPLGAVSQFVFDAGMAVVEFGPEQRKIDVGFPGGGQYSLQVCERVRAATQKPDPYSI